MIIRALDQNRDWAFGAGRQSYLTGAAAVAEDIETKLLSWLNDTFWNMSWGVDWRNLLGGAGPNVRAAIITQCRLMILKCPEVVRINSVEANLDSNRKLFVTFSVDTIFSRAITGSVVAN